MQKRRHHQLGSQACTRCQQLAHGQLIAAVGGHGGYRIDSAAQGEHLITAEGLREQLTNLRTEKALILKLVSLPLPLSLPLEPPGGL